MEKVKRSSVFVASLTVIGGIFFAPYISLLPLPFSSAKAQPGAAVAAVRTEITDPTVIQGVPRSLTIPGLGVDVAINEGIFDPTSQLWTIDEDSAFYATPTSPINNDAGSTLLYGHNSDRIFGKLPKLAVGMEAIIETDSDYVFTYVYKNSEIVDPTNVSVLNYSGNPRVVLQTCTGFWNEHRQMFYFYLKEYRKLQ